MHKAAIASRGLLQLGEEVESLGALSGRAASNLAKCDATKPTAALAPFGTIFRFACSKRHSNTESALVWQALVMASVLLSVWLVVVVDIGG